MTHAFEMFYGDYHEEVDEPEEDPRIREYLAAKHPDVHISDTGLALMSRKLADIKKEYGDPSLPTYRHYHNDLHTIDTFGYGFSILKTVAKIPGMEIRDSDYELFGLAVVWHDSILEPSDDTSPERRSADDLSEVMRAHGYDETLIARGENAVMATRVRIENWEVFQTNVKEAATDPVVFAIALADVGAIIFEGGQRMIQDVTNLALEISKSAVPEEELKGLLETQYTFVTQRVSDMSDYIDILCKGNKKAANQLKNMLLSQIKTNYQEALDVAKKLHENISEIGETVGNDIKKPVQQATDLRATIQGGILNTLRKIYRHASPEE